MNRRTFLSGLGAGAALSAVDWLRFFKQSGGVPGTKKSLDLAQAAADTAALPHFLIYWFVEGGWDSYSMFSPVDTRNDATLVIPAGELHPNPSWADQVYRPQGYGQAPNAPPKTVGNITYGFLAEPGVELFPDLAVISSHNGNAFHSGGRWDYHYGAYNHSLSAVRDPTERTVMQAFCEAYGASHLMPHISWHRWLADGELSPSNYPEGTGYYEQLGPPHAHTIYGKTPNDMRTRLAQVGNLASSARDNRVRAFVDNLNQNFLRDHHGESARSFSSAVSAYKALVGGQGLAIDPRTLFNDPVLRAEFGVMPDDELVTSTSVNNNPARSKESPNANVQAMMTYELMTQGVSCGFFIESREVRGFDSHYSRRSCLSTQGQQNQLINMTQNLWSPLKALVHRLKTTQYGTTGKSYWDLTTITLCSEMGRMVGADAGPVLSAGDDDATKYDNIMTQDVCQHWHVSSAAFLGGKVKGNTQWGRVGSNTLNPVPMLADGTLDPAFDPVTGDLKSGQQPSPGSAVTDCGSVYATSLYLADLDPVDLKRQGKGKNESLPLTFVKKP